MSLGGEREATPDQFLGKAFVKVSCKKTCGENEAKMPEGSECGRRIEVNSQPFNRAVESVSKFFPPLGAKPGAAGGTGAVNLVPLGVNGKGEPWDDARTWGSSGTFGISLV